MFLLSEKEQELLRKAGEDVKLLRPHAFAFTGERIMREETLAILREKWADLLVPVEYGGKGVSSLCYGMVLATLAKGDSSAALYLAMDGVAKHMINRQEVDEATKRRLFAQGLNQLFCAGISELRSTGHLPPTFIPKQVTAEKTDEGWVLNGTKATVTGEPYSENMMVFACLKKRPDITVCLVVPTGSSGMDEGREWDGVDAFQTTQSNSVTFQEVKVGPEAFVFETADFLRDVMAVNGIRTFGYRAVFLGVFERALEIASRMVANRVPEGLTQSVGHNPLVARAIGECGAWARLARLSLQEALWAFDNKPPGEPYAGMEEMFRAEWAIAKLTEAVPLLNRQVGLSGAGRHGEYRQCIRDIGLGGLIPPTQEVSEINLGAKLMKIDPTNIPTIR